MRLKTDYLLEPIRSDPRFGEPVRKVGLPPVAKATRTISHPACQRTPSMPGEA
jgi:hypothetical protein